MSELKPYQKEGVKLMLSFPPRPIYPTFYRIGQGQLQCTGPTCPLCKAGDEAKERVFLNARRMGKTNMANELFQFAVSRHTYNLLTKRETRWSRFRDFFRRLFAWARKLI